ncbi:MULTISPECIES: DNA ligase [unclassified Streptomyces]|uniref:ATP-dependent DNA ligase n=1 Tax=unclassified Streptomyces TaxID=2593676 RepID=UPI0036B7F2C4
MRPAARGAGGGPGAAPESGSGATSGPGPGGGPGPARGSGAPGPGGGGDTHDRGDTDGGDRGGRSASPSPVVLVPPLDVVRPRSADAIPPQKPPPHDLQYSLKLDGFRALAFVLDAGKVVLQSRTHRDLAPEFPGIAAELRAQLPPGIVLDGELCAYREGRFSFPDLLRSHADRVRSGVPVFYVAFDLLAMPGRDLRGLPLRDRWELLGAALRHAEPPLQRVLATRDEETARDWFRDLREAGVEGIVAKTLASPYRPGRGWAWRKVRHADTTDGVLVGLTGPADRPRALLVRLPDDRTVLTSPRLTPAQARLVGELVRDRLGASVRDPAHGPVTLLDRPLAVELRQVAGRHETAAFVRVRGEP